MVMCGVCTFTDDRSALLCLSASVQELIEIGVQKVGHRKKILTALAPLTPREQLLGGIKPVWERDRSNLFSCACDVVNSVIM